MAHAVFFSFSRGGMLALCIVGVVSFWLIPKRPSTMAWFALGTVLAFMMAGPEVTDRFLTVFFDAEERDGSAQSRLDMWKLCLNIMAANPVTGIGPDHFTVYASSYGLTEGKEAHTLWLQIGAELGIPGLVFLLSFYLFTLWGLYRFLKRNRKTVFKDEFSQHVPRMVITSLVGFMIAAQFVSLEGLEIPYYVALLGAGAIKINALNKLGGPDRPRRKVVWVERPQVSQQQQPVNV
jgi:O-antigen ligase